MTLKVSIYVDTMINERSKKKLIIFYYLNGSIFNFFDFYFILDVISSSENSNEKNFFGIESQTFSNINDAFNSTQNQVVDNQSLTNEEKKVCLLILWKMTNEDDSFFLNWFGSISDLDLEMIED